MQDYNFCPACGSKLPHDSSYCPSCGYRLGAVPSPPKKESVGPRQVLDLIGAWFAVLLLGLLTVNVLIALAVSPEILSNLGEVGYRLFLIVPFILDLGAVTGTMALLFYLAILIMLMLSFFTLVMRSGNIINEMRGDFSSPKSPLFVTATLFAAVLFFNYLFFFLVTILGSQPSTPDFNQLDDWALLYLLLNAAVYEELITRVLMIGIPLSLLIVYGKREGVWYKPLLGGTGMGDVEKFLIVFSAAFFALGHFEGWDMWKLLPTFIAGVAMGYLFVKYGLYASIMMHFSFNYLSAPYIYSGSLLVTVMIGMLIIGFLFIGIPYFVIYSKEAYENVTGKKLSFTTKEEPVEEPPVDKYPLPKAVCPVCSHQGAIYRNGELECPRCGNRY